VAWPITLKVRALRPSATSTDTLSRAFVEAPSFDLPQLLDKPTLTRATYELHDTMIMMNGYHDV